MNPRNPRLPRIIHQIWIGGPRPDDVARWTDGWRALHPGWTYHLWTDENLPALTNRAAFDAARSPAQRADIARYELIHRHGGIYMDADYECLAPLDALIAGRAALIVQDTCGKHLAQNGLFALPPGSMVTAQCIATIGRRFDPALPPNRTTGPYLLTKVVRRIGMSIEPLSILDGIARHHALASWVHGGHG